MLLIMGAGCSNRLNNTPEKDKDRYTRSFIKQSSPSLNKRLHMSVYHAYEYKNLLTTSPNNLIMFTLIHNLLNEFTVIEGEKKDSYCNSSCKVQSVAVGYNKGYKLDMHNQDKFFVLIDGNIEIYCLIDGHGPYGNLIAQYVQDYIFQVK
jgi:hypothetical protein